MKVERPLRPSGRKTDANALLLVEWRKSHQPSGANNSGTDQAIPKAGLWGEDRKRGSNPKVRKRFKPY